MEFGILGPVEAHREGRPLALRGPKQRGLLAFLLLHANVPVSRDRLIEALWGERPPAKAAQSLDSYISRIRREVGGERLQRCAPGYRLQVEAGELDLDRFDEALAEGRARLKTDPAGAVRILESALALWRGPALADVLYEPFAADEARRLEERRLLALEYRFEARLNAGDGAELVAELEQLVEQEPLREGWVRQLAWALYRAGRQAESLGVLQAARRRLAEELGLELAPQLRELETRILRHDPSLTPQTRSTAGAHAARGPRLRLISAVAVLGAAAAAVAALALVSGGGNDSSPRVAGARLLALRSGTGRIRVARGLVGAPVAAVTGGGSLWISEPAEDSVERISLATGEGVDRIRVEGEPGGLATGDDAVWVASTVGGVISRIDQSSDTVTQVIRLGGADATGIAFAAGALWVADATDRALVEISASEGEVRRTVTLGFAPAALTVARNSVWVTGHDDGVIAEVDARSGDVVATIDVGSGASAITYAQGDIWVANDLASTLWKIDPITGAILAVIPVGIGPTSVIAAAGSVWVASAYSATVSRVDPRRDIVTGTYPAQGQPSTLAYAQGQLWVGAASPTLDHRGGTLRLATTDRFGAVDPAALMPVALSYARLLYDGLLTFEVAPGPSGLQLVPDLALSIPRARNHGRTYSFHLRPGIRYSDGRLVRASDFRRAVERLFRIHSQGASFYDGLRGASACIRVPSDCDLSQSIVTNDRIGTITYKLEAPDPDFLYRLTAFAYFAPVPPGTPDHIASNASVPGTGPYELSKRGLDELQLIRNPFFREWSRAAQPAGNPDRIIWRFYKTASREVADVEQDRADWIFGLLPPEQLRWLELHHPAQLHVKPSFLVEFFPLNTHRAPFNDIRVRRALNYAIDRALIRQLYGGRQVASPDCQPLTPGMPGYRPYCPYTAEPNASGQWHAPDYSRALELVAASGTKGMRIDVWGTTDGFVPRGVPLYVSSLLRKLGYRVKLHLEPSSSITPEMRRRFQISVDGDWLPDYPRPSAYLPQFFSCNGGTSNGYVCNPRLDRRMQRADALQLSDSRRAAELWTRIDHEIVNNAYWVTTVNGHEPELVSRRLKNYQYSPVGDFIADQVWLH